ncbi:MCE family protein [Mycolicibacterium sp. XJ1819]
MRLNRRTRIQLSILGVVSLISITAMVVVYMQIPTTFLGFARYTVTVQLDQAGGLYERSNVSYRGVEVGRVLEVRLTDNGAEAKVQLKSDVPIPADVDVEVHSVSAIGEQYIALLPRSDDGALLKNGDVIAADKVHIPPDINSLLAATDRGLDAIPADNLKTVVDESYVAFGGLGQELSDLIKGSTALAAGARDNIESITNLIDHSKPLLDSQTQSADAAQAWAANLATVTAQLRDNDPAVRDLLQQGGRAADEVRQLLDRVQPTLPLLLANLVSVGQVALDYHANVEQLLVLLPQVVANVQSILVPNAYSKQDYAGAFLSFNLNLNLPPPCTTGFLPIQQQRAASDLDYPDVPDGDLYCRIPQDSAITAVRGARNYPCATRPGKRAPTAKMCENGEDYVPLNDGFNWKGDPNATYSGQDVPQLRDGATPPASEGSALAEQSPGPTSPVAIAAYDPATGTFVGPDGRVHTRGDLAHGAREGMTWEQMLTPWK